MRGKERTEQKNGVSAGEKLERKGIVTPALVNTNPSLLVRSDPKRVAVEDAGKNLRFSKKVIL